MSSQSDTAQDIAFLHEIANRKRNANEPYRIQKAVLILKEKGFNPVYCPAIKAVKFIYRGNEITFFPYKGWFSGKGINDGRGIENLIKQLN